MYILPDGGQAASPLEFLWRPAGWLQEGAAAAECREAGEEMEKALRGLDSLYLRVFEENLRGSCGLLQGKEAKMKVRLLEATPDAVGHIARCARVSHRSVSKGPGADAKLVRNLISRGHLSVLEFATATFLVSGISRACANQLTRHRLASFVQESQRYVDVRERALVVPDSIAKSNARQSMEAIYDVAVKLYCRMVSEGVPREDARYILPIGAETALTMAVNFREARHIIQLRGSRHAQWEIRGLAREMLDLLLPVAPAVFEDLEVSR